MGKLIFIVCALIFVIGIIKSSGANRLIWFFTGILFFQEKIIVMESPTAMSFPRLMIYTMLLVELVNPKKFYKDLKEFPLITPMFIIFIGFFFIGLFDTRHSPVLSVYRALDEFIKTFFVMFLCYVNFKRSEDWKKLFYFFLVASIISSMYGFYVFATKSNPYDNYITNLYNSISSFDQYALDTDERFRVNSFVSHPIYYGFVCGIFLIITFCHFIKSDKHRPIYIFAMAIIFMNLILTNSRGPLIATFFGLVTFIIIALNMKTKLNIFFYGIFVCLMIYNVPFIQEKINNSIDIFQTGGQKTQGSSVAMRDKQLEASINQYKKSPIFGNGFYYIAENLGFVDVAHNTADSDFQGFESYIYTLLIEEGALGIITNIIFFVAVGRYFLKNVSVSRHFAGLGFAIVLMFLMFSIGTGAFDSWVITMGMLGVLAGSINYSKNFEEIHEQLAKHISNNDELKIGSVIA